MIMIAAACSASDSIFARNYAFRHAGQKARGMFAYPLSDHITEMNALQAYAIATRGGNGSRMDTTQWCDKHFVNKKTADEALVLKGLLYQWWAKVLTPLREEMSSTSETH
jgi:hypothetical protein